MCKLQLSQRVWARKLVRWFGFLIHPNYDMEDIEISSCVGCLNYNPEVATTYRVMDEDDRHYYTITDEGMPSMISKEDANRNNTVVTGKVYYNKQLRNCYFVDSEELWRERLKESRQRVQRREGYGDV